MTAIELAETIEQGGVPFNLENLAAMLRKQQEAIVKLREALVNVGPCLHTASIGHDWIKQALKDTAQFDSLSQPAYTEELK